MTYRATRALALPAALAASIALAAPAAAQTPPAPQLAPAPQGQLELGSLEEAAGSGSLQQLLPQAPAQPGVGATAAEDTADPGAAAANGAGSTSGGTATGQGQISQYAAGAPGTFDPEALAQLSPQTATALGAVGSATLGSAALSLGPQGSQTGSVLLGGIIPGLTYVPGGSLGGEFVTSVGMTVPARTVFQGAMGLGSSALIGYFEAMAGKQERAELTEADIATWTGVLDSADELRAVASLPPVKRSDPRVQVPVIEPCRRDYPDQAKLKDDEAEAQCTEAKETIARGETWTSPDGKVTVTPEDAEPVVLGEDGKPVDATADGDADDPATGADGAADATDATAHDAEAAGAATDTYTAGAGTGTGTARAAQPVTANGAAAAQAPTVQAAGPQLASTGASVGDLALAALALLAAGGGMILAARRRA